VSAVRSARGALRHCVSAVRHFNCPQSANGFVIQHNQPEQMDQSPSLKNDGLQRRQGSSHCCQTNCKSKQQLTVFLVQPSNRRGNRAETLMPQCAFKMSMLNVSAIRIKSRSWLRSSSTHEPSDPPLGIVLFQSRQL
jgi:hypothetical protein